MWGVFFLSYAIAWPGVSHCSLLTQSLTSPGDWMPNGSSFVSQEYRHMKAEQEAKLQGKEGH